MVEGPINFQKFADLMTRIGFQENELIMPVFTLNRKDLKSAVLKSRYSKMSGHYRVVSMWNQEGEVALWARENRSGTRLFPVFKEEVDYLAKKKKFRKK